MVRLKINRACLDEHCSPARRKRPTLKRLKTFEKYRIPAVIYEQIVVKTIVLALTNSIIIHEMKCSPWLRFGARIAGE